MLFRRIEVLDQVDMSQGEALYMTMSGVQGLALSVQSIDVETIDADSVIKTFSPLFSSIDSDTRIKIISQARRKHKDDSKLSRTKAIEQMGYVEFKNFLLLERAAPSFFFFKNIFSKNKNTASPIDSVKLKEYANKFKNISVRLGKGDISFKPFASASKEDVEKLFLPISTEVITYPDYIVMALF